VLLLGKETVTLPLDETKLIREIHRVACYKCTSFSASGIKTCNIWNSRFRHVSDKGH